MPVLSHESSRSSDPDQSSPDTAQRLLDVVHLLVEASTFYTAVAKGTAAATLLVNSDSEPALERFKHRRETDRPIEQRK